MSEKLTVYNSLTRKKEGFEPFNPPFVGMYVCGPTVYNDVHLGNVRTFMTFDVIYRYLMHLGYKVRYVRNITDVGHLENDADEGEDKIAKKAKLENLEPMEIVHRYTDGFHQVMKQFNLLPPSIEPAATGHIIEQIEMVKLLIEKGFAYEVNGSVYFDVTKYDKQYQYGKLSGRVIEELMESGRDLDAQDEKRNKVDFALWKKAGPAHIMRWPSPWGEGFPGWHLECTVMSTKYLGETFDIHGGGLDLKFPHHECEIAQSIGSHGKDPVKYWLHTNMLTVNGQKMSKSLGNSFLPRELITGEHPMLDRAYSPMTVRFFMMQSHYSSTVDFSNEALQAAAKGYRKMINGLRLIKKMDPPEGLPSKPGNAELAEEVGKILKACTHAMNDDFNTALTIGHLFNLLKKINSLHMGHITFEDLGKDLFNKIKTTYLSFIEDVLGLVEEKQDHQEALIEALLELYTEAKQVKDYDKVDTIRARFKSLGIIVKDLKTGVEWAYEE